MMNNRQMTAELAKQFYSNEIAFDVFMDRVPLHSNDEKILELIGMIVHTPEKGGDFGLTDKEYEAYIKAIQDLIEYLAK